MTTFVLTVHEPRMDRALAAIAAAPDFVQAVELRLDALEDAPVLSAFRAATEKSLILTRRSKTKPSPFSREEIQRAIDAGFDWIDVELGDDLPDISSFGDFVILSVHDFEGMPDLIPLVRHMKTFPAAKRKIAVTPRTFLESEQVLMALGASSDPNLTMIGMGSRGLYSRILAPFFGSDLVFLAADEASLAAPGQLTIKKAQSIYGGKPPAVNSLFAVVGNPVGHSMSPEIHNPVFRQLEIDAAYSMIEVASLDEVTRAMTDRTPFAPAGLSITAPFKEDAFRFASSVNAEMNARARRSRAVNTLVRIDDAFIADNSDVVGFQTGLSLSKPSVAALIGAGGAARAALVALQDAGIRTTVFNRNAERGEAVGREFGVEVRPLSELSRFRADVVINALPGSARVDFPASPLYIDVAYGAEADERIQKASRNGSQIFDGGDFLAAQALPQFELFLRAAGSPLDSPRTRKSA